MAKKSSSLLVKYQTMYEKNPRSRVFAPLAESYRKLGLLDEAYKVLKNGFKHHPDYSLGHLVLAHCYYDQQKFQLVYETLKPLLSKNMDNIQMQKIFAETCIHLGHLEEALDTYKYLLFLNPQDKLFSEEVKKLEDDLQVGLKQLSSQQILKAPEQVEINEDDWVQVDFTSPESPKLPSLESESNDEDAWTMNRPEAKINPLKVETVHNKELEDDFYADEFLDYGDIEEVNEKEIVSDSPIISHTLIDLYCEQEYFDKALELLEKTLELNPDDLATRRKMSEVLAKKAASLDEQDGHDELISIIENQVKSKPPRIDQIETKFNFFLKEIKERANQLR
ncbi:MAG TPA: CDC27 family protein [Bacteriovoracaceae bacterium]|nr:CDC27 family protein [Bacteriovoracaceae bacterium]